MLYITSVNDTEWISEGACRTHREVKQSDIEAEQLRLEQEKKALGVPYTSSDITLTVEEIDILNTRLVSRLFHPSRGNSLVPAQNICAGCPVRAECFEYSLYSRQRQGVWGEASYRTRRRVFSMKKKMGNDDDFFDDYEEDYDDDYDYLDSD